MRYEQAEEIVTLVLADRVNRGERYRPDTFDNAISALVKASSTEDAITACEDVLLGSRISINPKWDGSIA